MKLALTVLMILCFVGVVYAGETSRGIYSVPTAPGFENYLNTTNDFSHTHEFDPQVGKTYDAPYGVGANIKVWDSDIKYIKGAGVETRYDFNNQKGSVYAVVDIDISSIW